MSNGPASESPILSCARCGAVLTPGRGEHYVVKIIAIADPAPPVITEQDLERDIGCEIRRLLDELKGVAEADIMADVYQSKILHLCTPCYRRWIADPVSAEGDSR
jgi:hypothetical protein